jgi:hypothetical protein
MWKTFRATAVALVAVAVAFSLEAQATRTWVSGVGDDVNPCSRTAPCKTFAGAISKTASGGIISVLDPGGYGTLSIGTLASTLNSGGINGFVINIAAGPTNRHVVLRNLLIDGSGTTLGLNGIRFLSGDSLLVEDCYIKSQSGSGIAFEPNSTASLTVRDTSITLATTNGILSKPSGGAIARVSVTNTVLNRNGVGFRGEDNTNAAIFETTASNNTSHGIFSFSAAGSTTLFVDSSIVSNNTGNGLRSEGGNSAMRVSNTSVMSNISTGVFSTSSGQLISYQNNRVFPAQVGGGFTSTLVQQ